LAALIPACAVPDTVCIAFFLAKPNGIVIGFKANLASFQAIAASAFGLIKELNKIEKNKIKLVRPHITKAL
jgi:hypothetical protein